MLTASALKALLQAHGLRLSPRLGQHHLVDDRLIRRLIEAARVSRHETVVEIGAGLGALTEPLAERAGRVIAVEVDRRICELLRDRMQERPNVEVVHQDILAFPWNGRQRVTVVGAIPYHITSPILVSLCDHRRAIRRAVLILQQEVAQRLIARPGTKAYGRLSILGQCCWEIRSLLAVPRSAFFPQPDVDSACVELLARTRPPVAVESEPAFFALVKAAFAHRRKTLVNCLIADAGLGIARDDAEAAVRQLGFAPTVRGESLSLEQFAALTKSLRRDFP